MKGYTEDWRGVPRAWKAALMVGRTIPRLWPPGSEQTAQDAADAVAFPVSRIGGEKAWRSLSPTQKLDCVATFILSEERAALRAAGVPFKELRDVLAVNQFWDRMLKELPFTTDAIDALVLNPRVGRVYSHEHPTHTDRAREKARRQNLRRRMVTV